MATESIIENVNIRDKNQAGLFLKALQKAEEIHCETVQISRPCVELSGEKIKEFFNGM